MNADKNVNLDTQVERVRESRVLDRSQSLTRLFDYLAAAAREDRSLRETDVAQDVFGRLGDLSGDASVRVCIHRLRRKLHDYYAGEGASQPHRLTVPLGEYRLVVENTPEPAEASADPELPRRRSRWLLAAGAAALLIAGNVAAWALIAREDAPARETVALARTPLWSSITGKRPVLVVIGDYFIFGERGSGKNLDRMVRDFNVNSSEDFDEMLMASPELAKKYVDINTYYTPVGATLALQRVLPIVRQAAGDPHLVQVITSSQLTPEMLKGADVVYIGYFSAMRVLTAPLFSRSRFEVGASYDELIDRKTRRSYTSEAGVARGDELNDDIGYVSAFGVSGRRFIIIAGTRDIGVAQAAEVATNAAAQNARKRPHSTAITEDIYQVRGMGRTNLGAIQLLPDGTRGASVNSGK